jgi:hypothetical protein
MLNDRKPSKSRSPAPTSTPKRAPDSKRPRETRVDSDPESTPASPGKKKLPVGLLVGAAAGGLLLLGLSVAVLGGDDEAKLGLATTSAGATASVGPDVQLAPTKPVTSSPRTDVKRPWGAVAAGLPTPELGAGPPDLAAIHEGNEGDGHDHAGDQAEGHAEHDDSCGGAGPDGGAADGATQLALLEEGLRNDPAALRGALDHFRAARKREDVELLASVLGRVPDPAVLSAAIEVAGRDAEPWRRAAALDLLDGLDTPAALPVAIKALMTEQDVEARRAAVHALPMPTGVAAREAKQVTTALVRAASSDADAEVRRRAAVALGDWARTAEDLAPVVAGLIGDPSIDVRAGCAFALEIARPTDPAARAALVAAVGRRDEDPLVRENAWRALGAAGPLADKEHSVWAAYRQEMGAAQK